MPTTQTLEELTQTANMCALREFLVKRCEDLLRLNGNPNNSYCFGKMQESSDEPVPRFKLRRQNGLDKYDVASFSPLIESKKIGITFGYINDFDDATTYQEIRDILKNSIFCSLIESHELPEIWRPFVTR